MTQSPAAEPTRGSIWPAVWLAFGLLAAALVARAVFTSASTPLLADTDDAMRLTTVRDLLAGQGWFDPMQHRLNTPFGAEMHWSRLVDLPIAGLIVFLQPFAGPAAATIAAYTWPLILLFGLLALSAMVTVKLVGKDGLLPALLLPALCVVTLVDFSPGRIDHHSVGILLTLAMLYCTMEALTRPSFAIGAGIAAAAALAIAMENLPSAVAAIMAFGLMWVLVPVRADALRSFGLSFGIAALALVALTLSPERWLTPACDALSLVYVAAAGGVGTAFLLLSLLPVRQTAVRLALGLGAGGLLVGGLALAFPGCLGGPYADLDPWLVEHWLNRVREAAPLWDGLPGAPAYVMAATVPSFLALAVTAWRVRFAGAVGRGAWLIYGLFLALAVVVMLVQVRGVRIAAELTTPAGAWLILAARRRYLTRGGPAEIAGLLASWTGFAGIAIAAVVSLAQSALPQEDGKAGLRSAGQQQACLMESAFAGLRALPRTRVMTQVDLGAHMLAYTSHEVVAAPYHRNQRGIRDTLEFFSRPIEEARSILDERGIGLVVVCPQLPEMRGMADATEDSFTGLYTRGELPDWLIERSEAGSPITVYEVGAS